MTIKVFPVPESRIVTVARFSPGSFPFEVINTIILQVKDITLLEIIAQNGLGSDVIVGVGSEGMESLVRRTVKHIEDKLDLAGAVEITRENHETFMAIRRDVSRNMVCPHFITLTAPPLSSEALLKKICELSSDIPLLGHPALGRFHVVCRDNAVIDKLRETVLAVGGKQPAMWGSMMKDGISGMFTKAELGLARSLKHELDPPGMLNPHVKLV